MLTSTSTRLAAATDGRARFASVDVVLPATWRDTECHDDDTSATSGEAVNYAEGFDGADFVVGPPAGFGVTSLGSAGVSGQFGGCGVASAGGVAVPGAVLVRDANVTEDDGESFFWIPLLFSIDTGAQISDWQIALLRGVQTKRCIASGCPFGFGA